MTPPWRSLTPEPPQQARSSRGQNGTVRACACPHLKPPPVLVCERGQAPASMLHLVPFSNGKMHMLLSFIHDYELFDLHDE